MLDKTRDRIINIFRENHGYMSYEALKSEGVTVLQLRELESDELVERFARGWYWCKACGLEKPADHRYIEINGNRFPEKHRTSDGVPAAG